MTNLQSIMELTQKDLDEIVELSTYNSMGTISTIIKELKAFRARISIGEKIRYNGDIITDEILRKIVEDNFSVYIYKAVFKEAKILNKVYFNVDNTEPGIDLVYTSDKPNKLFSWIADIDKEFCLIKLNPTGVIYIRNNSTRQIIPFISEKGNNYIYDEETGKIIEIM